MWIAFIICLVVVGTTFLVLFTVPIATVSPVFVPLAFVNSTSRVGSNSFININGSKGEFSFHWHTIRAVRSGIPHYALETPQNSPPRYSSLLATIPITLQDGDLIIHEIYDGPKAGKILSADSKLFREKCFIDITTGDSISWCTTTYCRFPMQMGGIRGPIATQLSQVNDFLAPTTSVDPYNGCFTGLSIPLQNIRIGYPSEYFIFDVNTAQFDVFTNGQPYTLDIDWGDESPLLENYVGSVANFGHTYPSNITRQVRIAGTMEAFIRPTTASIQTVHQFGKVVTQKINFENEVQGITINDLYWYSTTISDISHFLKAPITKRRIVANASAWYLTNIVTADDAFSNNIIEGLPNSTMHKLVGASYMFANADVYRIFSGFDPVSAPNASHMFYNANLYDFQTFTGWALHGSSFDYWFSKATIHSSFDSSVINFSGFTNGTHVFRETNFTGSSKFGAFPSVTNGNFMFYQAIFSSPADVASLTFPTIASGEHMLSETNMHAVYDFAVLFPNGAPVNSRGLFDSSTLELCDFASLDVSKIVNGRFLFTKVQCTNGVFNAQRTWNFDAATILVSSFESLNPLDGPGPIQAPLAVDIHNMFCNCTFGVVSPQTAQWFFPNATNMASLFADSDFAGHSVDASTWNAPLIDASLMFVGVKNCTVANLTNLVQSAVTTTRSMFLGSFISTLIIDGWDTRGDQNMEQMFRNTLGYVNVSWFNTSSLVTANQIFEQSNMDPDLSSWYLGAVTIATNIINECHLSIGNYDGILINFANFTTLSSQTMGAPRSNFLTGFVTPVIIKQNYTAVAEHDILVARSWILDDGGIN